MGELGIFHPEKTILHVHLLETSHERKRFMKLILLDDEYIYYIDQNFHRYINRHDSYQKDFLIGNTEGIWNYYDSKVYLFYSHLKKKSFLK